MIDVNYKLMVSAKELEQNIVGNLLLNNEYLCGLDLFDTPFRTENFVDKRCALIFDMMRCLQFSGQADPTSIGAIFEYAKSINRLPQIGGEAYLFELAKHCETFSKDVFVQLFDLLYEKQVLLELVACAESMKHEDLTLDQLTHLSGLCDEMLMVFENDALNDKVKDTKWPDVLGYCKFEGLAAALMDNCALVSIDILPVGVELHLSVDPAVESIAMHFRNKREKELTDKLSGYFKCPVFISFGKTAFNLKKG